MKTRFYLICFLLMVCGSALAAHIGNTKIIKIRNFTPEYVVVWLDRPISNPPACASVMNKIILNATNTDWGNQRLGMLMTAMAAGLNVNPNCTTTCKSNWDGQLTVCNEMSIGK